MADEITQLEGDIADLKERVSQIEEAIGDDSRNLDSSGMSDFVESKDPSNHIEIAAAIGYYLVNHGSLDPFTFEDIKDGYIECREPLPANVSDLLSRVEDKGYFMLVDSGGDRYQWTLTKTGIEVVEEGFES